MFLVNSQNAETADERPNQYEAPCLYLLLKLSLSLGVLKITFPLSMAIKYTLKIKKEKKILMKY